MCRSRCLESEITASASELDEGRAMAPRVALCQYPNESGGSTVCDGLASAGADQRRNRGDRRECQSYMRARFSPGGYETPPVSGRCMLSGLLGFPAKVGRDVVLAAGKQRNSTRSEQAKSLHGSRRRSTRRSLRHRTGRTSSSVRHRQPCQPAWSGAQNDGGYARQVGLSARHGAR